MKRSVDQRTQIPSERSYYVGGVFCVSNDVTAFFFCSEKFAVISQKHDTVGKNDGKEITVFQKITADR